MSSNYVDLNDIEDAPTISNSISEAEMEQQAASNAEYAESHAYMLENDETLTDVFSSLWVEPNSYTSVPVVPLQLVVLPGQVVPIWLDPAMHELIKDMFKLNSYFGVVPAEFPHDRTQVSYGVLLEIRSISKDEALKVIAIARQRFRTIESVEFRGAKLKMTRIRVLEDITLPSFPKSLCSRRQLSSGARQQMKSSSAFSGTPVPAITFNSLVNRCNELAEFMKVSFSTEMVESRLNQGATEFSYWVGCNLPIGLDLKYDLLKEDVTDLRIIQLLEYTRKLTDIACKTCKQFLCNVDQVIQKYKEGSSGHFINTGGYIHEMLTVSHSGGVPHGDPSSEFTWFNGYEWQILLCRFCGTHLGWKYTSDTQSPDVFFGLSRSQIELIEEEVVSTDPESDIEE